MLQNPKKKISQAILFLLLFNVSNSYSMKDTFFKLSVQNAQTVVHKAREKINQTKEYIQQKVAQVKEKIGPYATTENVTIAGCLATFLCLNTLAIVLYKSRINKLRNAPQTTKKEVIKLAKKLKVKNPQNIKVKVLNNNNYNGGSDIFGNILITKKANNKIKKNKSKFVIGHELSHHKHNDAIISYLTRTVLKLSLFGLYAACKPLKKVTNYLKDNPENKTTKKIKSFTLIATINYMLLNKLGPFLCDVVVSNTIGKAFEKRADLQAASLGKPVAKGGIKLFRKSKRKNTLALKKLGWKKWVKQKLTDPHPSKNTRISYLKKFKKQTYGSSNFITKFCKKFAKKSVKNIKKVVNKLPKLRKFRFRKFKFGI